MRDDLSDGLNFLANRPAFTGFCTGTPVIPASAFTAISLDTDQSDPWNGHSPLGADPQNWYCQAPGWYLGEGHVPWTYTSATSRLFGAAIGVSTAGGLITLKGQQHWTNSGQNPGVFAADIFELSRTGAPGSSGSDFVQLQAFTTATGVSVQGSTPNNPRLSVRWIGTGADSALGAPASPGWPVPPAFVTPAFLNASIRDALRFLANPPFARLTGPVPPFLTPGTFPAATAIGLGAVTVDNYSAADGEGWTAPVAGVHYIYAQADLAGSPLGGIAAAGVSVNGNVTFGQSVQYSSRSDPPDLIVSACGRFRLNAGDEVALAAFQSSTSSLPVGPDSKLIIIWECA